MQHYVVVSLSQCTVEQKAWLGAHAGRCLWLDTFSGATSNHWFAPSGAAHNILSVLEIAFVKLVSEVFWALYQKYALCSNGNVRSEEVSGS